MMTQSTIRVGGKKSGFDLIVDDAPVPSRGASQKTRARWAVAYLRRLVRGDALSKRLVEQAIRWSGEVARDVAGPHGARASRAVARLDDVLAGTSKPSRLVEQAVRWIDDAVAELHGRAPEGPTPQCACTTVRGGRVFRCTLFAMHSGRHAILTKSRGYLFFDDRSVT